MKTHWDPKCRMCVEHLCLVCQTAPSNELAVAFDVVFVVGNGADIHFAQSSWPADEFQKVALILRNQRDCFPQPDIRFLHEEQGRLANPANNLIWGLSLWEWEQDFGTLLQSGWLPGRLGLPGHLSMLAESFDVVVLRAATRLNTSALSQQQQHLQVGPGSGFHPEHSSKQPATDTRATVLHIDNHSGSSHTTCFAEMHLIKAQPEWKHSG